MQQNEFADQQLFENQFLSDRMSYQSCPFCSRSFFRGKLVFHLKLCSQQCPMLNKSQKTSPVHKKNALSAVNSYERCVKCQTRIPSYLKKRHQQNCNGGTEASQIYTRSSASKMKKTHQNYSEQIKNQTFFPKIRKNMINEACKKLEKKLNVLPVQVKVRDQLRCYRRAEEVQKVTCDNCGRKFSQRASLRHIPICATLKMKQIKQKGSLSKTKNFMNPTLKMRSTRTNSKILSMKNNSDTNNIKQSITNENSHCNSVSMTEVLEPTKTNNPENKPQTQKNQQNELKIKCQNQNKIRQVEVQRQDKLLPDEQQQKQQQQTIKNINNIDLSHDDNNNNKYKQTQQIKLQQQVYIQEQATINQKININNQVSSTAPIPQIKQNYKQQQQQKYQQDQQYQQQQFQQQLQQ